MTIEITKKEAMWIINKAAKTCADGELAISRFSKEEIEKDDFLKKAIAEARSIIEAAAELGLKIANALEKELDTEE
jgi:hypothetical protein